MGLWILPSCGHGRKVWDLNPEGNAAVVSQRFTPPCTRRIFQGLCHGSLQDPHSMWVYIPLHWLWDMATVVVGGDSACSRLRLHVAWHHGFEPALLSLCSLKWEGCAQGYCFNLGPRTKTEPWMQPTIWGQVQLVCRPMSKCNIYLL